MNKTILHGEESIQEALESLRSIPSTPALAAVLDLLVPEGYHPVVELQENGRKKRGTASLENWSPETGEIVISFSKEDRTSAAEQREPRIPSPAIPESEQPIGNPRFSPVRIPGEPLSATILRDRGVR